jgi:hypothetical protein
MPPALTRLRTICLALPEAHEVEAWGTPTFRVKNKLFAMWASADTHVGKGRNGVWLKQTRDNQDAMLSFAPKKFFRPPYVGTSGWVGVYLDRSTDWKELKELVKDAYCLTAPRKMAKALESPAPAATPKRPARPKRSR